MAKTINWTITIRGRDAEIILEPNGEGVLRDVGGYSESLKRLAPEQRLLSAIFQKGTKLYETTFRLSSEEAPLYFRLRDAVRDVERLTAAQLQQIEREVLATPSIQRAVAVLTAS